MRKIHDKPHRGTWQGDKWLGRYLKGTSDKGLISRPNVSSFQVFVDSDFAGNWDRSTTRNDKTTARSRIGYIITYAGYPIVWASKIQQEIALSSTEAEFTRLSYALQTTIPVMELLKVFHQNGHEIQAVHPQVQCKVFEDNSGAIEFATVPIHVHGPVWRSAVFRRLSPDRPTNQTQRACRTEVAERWQTMIYMKNAETNMFGSVAKDLHSQQSLKSDQYPKTIVAAPDILDDRKWEK
jgi:hypothetical protein